MISRVCGALSIYRLQHYYSYYLNITSILHGKWTSSKRRSTFFSSCFVKNRRKSTTWKWAWKIISNEIFVWRKVVDVFLSIFSRKINDWKKQPQRNWLFVWNFSVTRNFDMRFYSNSKKVYLRFEARGKTCDRQYSFYNSINFVAIVFHFVLNRARKSGVKIRLNPINSKFEILSLLQLIPTDCLDFCYDIGLPESPWVRHSPCRIVIPRNSLFRKTLNLTILPHILSAHENIAKNERRRQKKNRIVQESSERGRKTKTRNSWNFLNFRVSQPNLFSFLDARKRD